MYLKACAEYGPFLPEMYDNMVKIAKYVGHIADADTSFDRNRQAQGRFAASKGLNDIYAATRAESSAGFASSDIFIDDVTRWQPIDRDAVSLLRSAL